MSSCMENERLKKELGSLTRGRLFFDEPMSRHTSIGVGGRADVLLYPAKASEVAPVVSWLRERGVAFLPVGNCTNLIVRDAGFRGVLICLSDLKAMRLKEQEDGRVVLSAEAGVALAQIVHVLMEESLTGMEFCAGIPGSVGGGIRMNAGAYGHALGEITEKISIVNGSGKLKALDREHLRFEYRNLSLPDGAVIVSAELTLRKGAREEIRQEIVRILEERRNKHPLLFPSAGSIFKNPTGMPAGRIIEELGLKGIAVGGARISEMHGNFIVNTGGATAGDVLTLMKLIREKSAAQKGITLEAEVKVVGEGDEALV